MRLIGYRTVGEKRRLPPFDWFFKGLVGRDDRLHINDSCVYSRQVHRAATNDLIDSLGRKISLDLADDSDYRAICIAAIGAARSTYIFNYNDSLARSRVLFILNQPYL